MKLNEVSVLLLQTLVITGDPQKGPGGALAPLAFENMQIYLKIGKGSVIAGPPKVRPGSPMFVTLHSHSHLPPIFCHLKVSHAPLQQASDGRASLDASYKPCCYRNKKGGRWLINLDKKQRGSCLDNFWLEVVSFCRGYFLAQSGYLSNY